MRLPERTAPLDADGDFTGATITVRTRPVGVGVLLRTQELVAVCISDNNRERHVDSLAELSDIFAAHGLISWNIEDHEGEIPATRDGLRRLTFDQQVTLAIDWVSKVVNPPRPLSRPSSAGARPRAARRSPKS